MSQGYLIFPEFDPIIFSIGPISLRWYGTMYLLGFIFAVWLCGKRSQRYGWNKEQVSDLFFAGFMGVILGGRIGYVLFYNFEYFMQDPLYIFKIWTGGMSFHGGLLGVMAAVLWYGYKNNRSFFAIMDFVAPVVPFGLGAGRLGNFINGELWGRVTDVPWAMIFPTGGIMPRHPSQLYEVALEGIALFIVLNLFIRNKRPQGSVSGMFLLFYGLFRFIIEYFREPDEQLGLFAGGISMGQILSTPMILGGIGLIVWAYKRNGNKVL